MITRSPGNRCATASTHGHWRYSIVCLLAASALLAIGCGAPGEPVPPSPPIPVAVLDLNAQQLGDGVLVSFTLPVRSVTGEKLDAVPTLEVLRGSLRPDGAPDAKSFRVVDTVPGALLGGYVRQGKVEFLDPISPEEPRAHPGEKAVYRVRTRVSDKKASANSNDVVLNLYAVPERIDSLEANLTVNGIQLKWTAPAKTSGGEPLSSVQEYRLYRGELDPASAEAAQKDLHQAAWKSPLLRIATTTATEYQDTGFDYGKTYVYVVRSVISAGNATLESSESRVVILVPRDTFPPAAPADLVAAALASGTDGKKVVDLSWSINVEPDLAGYRVYRRDREDSQGQLLTPELLPTPAYRDLSVSSGHRYSYFVTAVDRAGNESPPSAASPVEIP
jgi:hypothetical protein